MDNLLIHEYNVKAENVSKKVIYHFSDCHLTQWDELSDEQETEKAKKQTAEWKNIRKYFAESNKEPYGDAQQATAKAHFENLIDESKKGDAVILAGDTFNYINGANIRLSEEKLSELNAPYMVLCGNHDTPKELPDSGILSKAKAPYQIISLADMAIIGLDNSARIITAEQIDALKKLLEENKPIIIAMHIPIKTEANSERLEKCGEYFYINYDGCPKENLELIDIIKENAERIICILAGHLHFVDNTEIAPNLMQYVSSQGITGNLNKYIIGE